MKEKRLTEICDGNIISVKPADMFQLVVQTFKAPCRQRTHRQTHNSRGVTSIGAVSTATCIRLGSRF